MLEIVKTFREMTDRTCFFLRGIQGSLLYGFDVLPSPGNVKAPQTHRADQAHSTTCYYSLK
jgi:hypothetical protein